MSPRSPPGFTHAMKSEPDTAGTRRWLYGAIIVATISIALIVLSGCNTFGGAGKDIENAGDAIADTNEGTAD